MLGVWFWFFFVQTLSLGFYCFILHYMLQIWLNCGELIERGPWVATHSGSLVSLVRVSFRIIHDGSVVHILVMHGVHMYNYISLSLNLTTCKGFSLSSFFILFHVAWFMGT